GLAATTQAEYKPLFVREVMFSLEAERDNTSGSLVSAPASGARANAALSVTLARDQALGVLSALDGAASGLSVRASISYRTAAIDQVIHLTGSWAAIFDYIHTHLGTDGMVSLADLQQYFADMLKANIISADQISATGMELPLKYADSGALFSAFMRVAS